MPIPSPTVDPAIQSRVRQLLNLRGGPLINVAEFVQPVALISAWNEARNPVLEVGDQIPRRFVAEFSSPAVAAQFSYCSIRSAAAVAKEQRYILLVDKLHISSPAAGTVLQVAVGRRAAAAHASNGSASWCDTRLAFTALLESPIGIGGGSDAGGGLVANGFRWINVPINDTVTLELHEVLTAGSGSSDGQLLVESTVANVGIRASFEGWAWPEQR